MTSERPEPTPLSERPAVGWILLIVAVPAGGWLIWEIHRTIGLSDPHFWTLLKVDRVFDVAMLDFLLTSGWAGLVLFERSSRKDWRAWLSLAIFCVVPSLGIAAWILLGGRKRAAPAA